MKKKTWRDKRDSIVPKSTGFGKGVMNKTHFDLVVRLTRRQVEALSRGEDCAARTIALDKIRWAAHQARHGNRTDHLRKDRPEDRDLKREHRRHRARIEKRERTR